MRKSQFTDEQIVAISQQAENAEKTAARQPEICATRAVCAGLAAGPATTGAGGE